MTPLELRRPSPRGSSSDFAFHRFWELTSKIGLVAGAVLVRVSNVWCWELPRYCQQAQGICATQPL